MAVDEKRNRSDRDRQRQASQIAKKIHKTFLNAGICLKRRRGVPFCANEVWTGGRLPMQARKVVRLHFQLKFNG